MRLLLTGCRLPQNREFVSAICSQNPVYPDQRVLRIAVPCLHANAAGIGVLRLVDFILPGVQDTSERAR